MDEKSRKKILEAARATEMHMALSCIAMGILQCISIGFIGKVSSEQLRYQRTPARGRVSEAAIMHYFRKYFLCFLALKPDLLITQIIRGYQELPHDDWNLLVS